MSYKRLFTKKRLFQITECAYAKFILTGSNIDFGKYCMMRDLLRELELTQEYLASSYGRGDMKE